MVFNEELRKLRLSYELMKRKIDKMMVAKDQYRKYLEFKEIYKRINHTKDRVDEIEKKFSGLGFPIVDQAIKRKTIIKHPTRITDSKNLKPSF